MDKKIKVEDYMIRNVVTLPPDVSVEEATRRLISTEFHGLPVSENGKLVGFITAKELLRAASKPAAKIRDIIRKGTVSVPPDMDIDDAARILFRYGLRNLPVVDREGKLIGMISNIDIVRSHIERATPTKVMMIKSFLESKHRVGINVKRRVIPIESLRPTQHEVYADELRGRQYEIRRGLVEPIIVVQKKDHFLLIDGHHRVLAAKAMGVRQFTAFVLEPSIDVELGLEKTATERGLFTMDDVKIIEGSHHPLVEVTTRLLRERG